MNTGDLNTITAVLLERKRTLWKEILTDLERDTGKDHRDLIDTIKENGDMGLEELRQSNAFTLIELKYMELSKIEDALERIEEGKYGRCLDCGGFIHSERLKALPYAVRCRDCQATHEKGERRSGGH